MSLQVIQTEQAGIITKDDKPDLYLIVHKVRGEPAFDIAIKMEVYPKVSDETFYEEYWIIPTSGHRAYPYRYWLLEDLVDASDYPHAVPAAYLEIMPPSDLPDHYQVSAAPKGKGSGTQGRDLLAKLGLIKAPEPMTRRSW